MVDNGYQGETRQYDIDAANEEQRISAYYRGERVKELEAIVQRQAAVIRGLREVIATLGGERDVIVPKPVRLPFDPKE